ncbi:MAG: hypothetical protein ACLSUW_08755 [Akkermansia sp.]
MNMRAIFVDNGLLRKNEAEEVRANFARMNVESETVDASERFLAAPGGESDPEKKRRIIGGLFIDVFWDAVGDAEMLAQGTLYPDVIESASNAKSRPPSSRPTTIAWNACWSSRRGESIGTPGGTVQGRVRELGALWASRMIFCGATPSPVRPGRALPRRGHQRTPGHHPGMRRHLHRQPEKIRLV